MKKGNKVKNGEQQKQKTLYVDKIEIEKTAQIREKQKRTAREDNIIDMREKEDNIIDNRDIEENSMDKREIKENSMDKREKEENSMDKRDIEESSID